MKIISTNNLCTRMHKQESYRVLNRCQPPRWRAACTGYVLSPNEMTIRGQLAVMGGGKWVPPCVRCRKPRKLRKGSCMW